MSRNEERKPSNNYSCCIKPILTLEHDQMSLSGASLLEKDNLRRTMNYFDAAEKIHVCADANKIILISISPMPLKATLGQILKVAVSLYDLAI